MFSLDLCHLWEINTKSNVYLSPTDDTDYTDLSSRQARHNHKRFIKVFVSVAHPATSLPLYLPKYLGIFLLSAVTIDLRLSAIAPSSARNLASSSFDPFFPFGTEKKNPTSYSRPISIATR